MTVTSSNALREGFREVLRDPALLLIEIGWRWTFGLLAVLLFLYSLFLLLGNITLDPRRLEALSALPGLQLVQTISDSIATLSKGMVRISLLATVVGATFWVPLSAFGRYATLNRPAFAPGAGLGTCLLISAARALLTLGCVAAWVIAGIFAGLLGAASTQGPLPNPSVLLAILAPVLVVIVTVWSTLNWYSSFAPLFPNHERNSMVADHWAFVRLCRDELLEISIVIGVMRAVLFLAASILCLGVSSIVGSPRIVLADFLAIALLYFLAADFLYVVRLAAYTKLRKLSN